MSDRAVINKIGAALAGLVVASMLTGPAAAENVLRWASAGGPLSFDPHAHNETPTKAQLNQVYEKLLDLDSNLQLAPALAIGVAAR
jgi:ABC-type oligopeptide transport system substrate-binding subunit